MSRKGAKAQRVALRGFSGFRHAVRDSLDSIFDERLSKIDQEAQSAVAQAEVREQLFRRDGWECFNRLQFNDEFVLDDQVSTEAFLENKLIINDGDRHLPLDSQPVFAEFVSKCDFVHGFKQAWPERRVNLVRGIDDDRSDLIFVHTPPASQIARSSRFNPLRLCAFA